MTLLIDPGHPCVSHIDAPLPQEPANTCRIPSAALCISGRVNLKASDIKLTLRRPARHHHELVNTNVAKHRFKPENTAPGQHSLGVGYAELGHTIAIQNSQVSDMQVGIEPRPICLNAIKSHVDVGSIADGLFDLASPLIDVGQKPVAGGQQPCRYQEISQYSRDQQNTNN